MILSTRKNWELRDEMFQQVWVSVMKFDCQDCILESRYQPSRYRYGGQAAVVVEHSHWTARMKSRMILLALIALLPSLALGRILPDKEPKALVSDARLVFVGRVKSVKPSDIKTGLSYPPYEGVTFRWQMAEVEVIEPFKGVRKGDVVQTAMLSVDEHSRVRSFSNPPGMLEPRKDDIFFFCLGATLRTNVFAALLAPYNENLSVFPLYRSGTNQVDDEGVDEDGFLKKMLLLPPQSWITNEGIVKQIEARNKQYALIYSLVGASGDIQPPNVQKFRETFATDLAKAPSTNMVYLEWKTYTNAHGWMSDVPKEFEVPTNINEK